MALIQWSSALSVGVAEIDKQHQQLIDMINKLQDAMLKGKGKDILGPMITGLATYTKTHFSTEEKYFDKFGYPQSSEHKAIHIDFVQKVVSFKSDFDSGKAGLTIDIQNFLSNWLKSHIMGTDKQYTAFFNEKGLK